MNLEAQQDLYDSLKKLIEKSAGDREYCLFISVEIGERGSGLCMRSSITSLTNISPMGSWKGLIKSIGELNEKFSNSFFNISDLEPYSPVQPKG